MEYLGKHFEREVYWMDYKNCITQLPDQGWVCLAISNSDPQREFFTKFAEASIKHGILEFKSWGLFSENLHELFDETIVRLSANDREDCLIVTTWHSDEALVEAFWQCFYATSLPEEADWEHIKIICVDLDGTDRKKELKSYIKEFQNGWIPN